MSELLSPRILVTGATGFIGTHLCRLLIKQGKTVRATTRGFSGLVEGVDYRTGDLHDESFVRSSLEGIDCIIHLAGRAHVLDKKNDALSLYRKTNHDLTIQLAKQAVSCGIKRFIFLSSIGVNGKLTKSGRFNEACAADPSADYAVSKFEDETSLKDLLRSESMEWVIVRPPLVYGADAPGNFKTLLRVVHRGLPSPFMWVNNSRSIVSIDNLSHFISIAVDHPDASREVFLVSDDSDISTDDMLSALSVGMQRRFLRVPVPEAMLRFAAAVLGKKELYTQLCGSLIVDCSKAKGLGYRPHSDTYSALVDVGQKYAARISR